ncbi:Uncharacterised protein [Legionella spiritensis]|nr:Uncharacterised protein [Legionella spiritensis]
MRENVHKWHIKPAIRPQASLRATVFSQKMVRRKFLFTEPRANGTVEVATSMKRCTRLSHSPPTGSEIKH